MASVQVQLQPKIIYGLRTDIHGNGHFLMDEEVLYPVGNTIVVHNFPQNHQRMLRLSDKVQLINLIVTDIRRKFVAVCEEGDKPIITIYDLTTLKRRKVLGLPNIAEFQCQARKFVSVAFTMDTKYVIAVTGDPDWMLYGYNWEKGKIDSSCKALPPNTVGTISQVQCNPMDPNTIVLIGDPIFRLLAITESVWRQWGHNKAENWNLTSATWLSQEQLLCGSEDGRIFLFESGELKGTYNAINMTCMDFKKQIEETTLQYDFGPAYHSPQNTLEVTNLIGFPRGFAYACGLGMVHVFERESSHRYRRRNIYRIPDVTFRDGPQYFSMIRIHYINVNFSADRMLATCQRNQLYVVKLKGLNMQEEPCQYFEPLGPALHQGPVSTVSVCAWKPIFMTCGAMDRSVRLWDYATEQLMFVKEYQEDVHTIAIHPTGLFAAIGFSDKLRYVTVFIDDFAPLYEFPVRNCKYCGFSTHGQMLAAVNGTTIQIFSTVSFEMLYSLKGHNAKITSISWSPNDMIMNSCSLDGALYEWRVAAGEWMRTSEVFIKENPFKDCCIADGGKFSLGVGVDGNLKQLADSSVQRSIFVAESSLDSMALSRSGEMLFVSGPKGFIYSVQMPLVEANEPNLIAFKVHFSPNTKIRLTYDDKQLISASTDGSICIWKLLFAEGKTVDMDEKFRHNTQTLIANDDLQRKVTAIRMLTKRLSDMEAEHAYQLQELDTNHTEKTRELQDNYNVVVEELKERIEILEQQHTSELNHLDHDFKQMTDHFERTLEEMELKNNEKLIYEYEKHAQLEEKLDWVRSDYDRQLRHLQEERKRTEDELHERFGKTLADRDGTIEELQRKLKEMAEEHEVVRCRIEDDADLEIEELRAKHDVLLKEEQEANFGLRGRVANLRKRQLVAQKEIDSLKVVIGQMDADQVALKLRIGGLERDIEGQKKEIAERDDTIQDKEKRIYDLKHKNKELEKCRFVLDYKLEELREQIEPKDKQIADQLVQIDDMLMEIEMLQQRVVNLELQIQDLRDKLRTAEREIHVEMEKSQKYRTTIKQIRMDVYDTSRLIQDPKQLKTAVRRLFQKYVDEKDFWTERTHDVQMTKELLQQRENLERTVERLKGSAGGIKGLK